MQGNGGAYHRFVYNLVLPLEVSTNFNSFVLIMTNWFSLKYVA